MMNNKPLLGIIGGMGTAAGLHFQKLFFDVCNKNGIKGDDNYPEWVYFNASKAPDRTEALLKNGTSPVEYLVEVINKLEKYQGYLSCDDVFCEFAKYPLFSENGALLVVQINNRSYSMTKPASL